MYNTAAVIDADGEYLGKYRKNHIPHTTGFWEKFFFKRTLMENEKYFQCIFPYILSCLFGPRMVESCNTNVISALDYKALERPATWMKPSFSNGFFCFFLIF